MLCLFNTSAFTPSTNLFFLSLSLLTTFHVRREAPDTSNNDNIDLSCFSCKYSSRKKNKNKQNKETITTSADLFL